MFIYVCIPTLYIYIITQRIHGVLEYLPTLTPSM